ncbi:MAG: 30S ribosomal protein S20 [Parcubacteria group bacterium]|nr:30S ribosomal protein S20 [Parcubacteria group bacterium]
MPIKKSAFKALTQSNKKQQLNKKVKSDLSALVRKVRKSVDAKDSAKAADWLKQTVKKIDRAAQKGIIKKNTAARKKSRLSKVVNNLAKK